MPEPMLCPIDKTPLVMSERQNIEIDYCPTCRGVWLDRGELDKIIERSAEASAPAPAAASPPPQPQPGFQPQGRYGHGHHGHGYYGKRKKSFLEELFD
ncbi:MAG TPA: zf-TFIIB domain-containing protein [Microvirga sp.]|nr:zf-TFIIB domain-containing protein [Microvirga sp.]